MGFLKSEKAEAAYQFITEVEAFLPRQRVLYHDAGRHLFEYENYYGTGELKPYSLQQWKASAKSGPAPYFISNYGRVMHSGIQGVILIEQQIEGKDRAEARVLFQPVNPADN